MRSASDFDKDGDVDQADFGYLQACLSGMGEPNSPLCVVADLSGDGDVDQIDLALFQSCLGGPNTSPGC